MNTHMHSSELRMWAQDARVSPLTYDREIEKKDKKWSVNFGSKVKADGDGLQCEAIDWWAK